MLTIAGHIGDANFHIIPLVNLANPAHRKAIMELTPKIYELVAKYKGSITGEHGVGVQKAKLLREQMMAHEGEEALRLMKQIKKIFDPVGIMNPGKYVEAA